MTNLTAANIGTIVRTIIAGMGTIAVLFNLISPGMESQLELAVFQIVMGIGLLGAMLWGFICNQRHAKVEIAADAAGVDVAATKAAKMSQVKADANEQKSNTS